MPFYHNIQKEETFKSLVHEDYFSGFGYEPNIDNIDFVITDKGARSDLFSDGTGSSTHFLWAEAKKGNHDPFALFTQLLLTCRKTYERAEYLAPPWLGAFDQNTIAFVSFHDILPIFNEPDFNWNTTPSNHEAADFQKAKDKVKKLIGAKIAVYTFGVDDGEIHEFIETRFAAGAGASLKSPITKDNFVQIFIKWVKEVKPFINIPKDEWAEFKQRGVLDCDFYRADMMSYGGNTITEKLKIVLKQDNYKFHENIRGRLFTTDIDFTDGGGAYNRFWNKYERPPAAIYQKFIMDRRDLLMPQNIREMKGSFFTPKVWAEKSKEYLASVFGVDWQETYYVWDCAAGTGNLLAGLTNPYNVWASDIDQGNVETIQALIDIDENLDLLPAHVFQFDFLNDDFDKLPRSLREIINDPVERRKLIIYINPPYAEPSNRATINAKGKNRTNLVKESRVYNIFSKEVGAAVLELFIQFFLRIYKDLSNVKLASFSTLKYINSQNLMKFREYFKADFKAGFICQANTFDNVNGKFPICFSIFELENKQEIASVEFDVLLNDANLTKCWNNGKKSVFTPKRDAFIINWLRQYYDNTSDRVGYLRLQGTDFANNQGIFFTSYPSKNDFEKHLLTNITEKNLNEICIYLAVRHCIEHTWINHNDQFLYPNEGWENDITFQNDCLMISLFHGKNHISSQHGINHWIPFTEKEVDAQERFASHFMSGFLKGKTFSAEAQAVLDAGRELWKYYHAKIKGNRTASVNASFYDIREFFQGRNDKGTMKTRAEDETYNKLLGTLREKLRTLTEKIQPKVYEYGFLKE